MPTARAVIRAGGLASTYPPSSATVPGWRRSRSRLSGAISKDKLEIGMVLTIAPGVHIPGWGGVRVSDCVLVTRGKPVSLAPQPPSTWWE